MGRDVERPDLREGADAPCIEADEEILYRQEIADPS